MTTGFAALFPWKARPWLLPTRPARIFIWRMSVANP